MIPAANAGLRGDIEITEPASRTFALDMDNNVVSGYTDGRAAIRQAIYLIVGTERYRWPIFSWNYGIELEDLFGRPMSWVIPEVKRRVQEALGQDTRISSVDSFVFDQSRGKLRVTFAAHTIFGDIPIENGVEIDV